MARRIGSLHQRAMYGSRQEFKSFRSNTPVGTGAVGAIYSWRLSASTYVATVCRSNYDIVQRDGFDISSVKWGNHVYRPVKGVFLFFFILCYYIIYFLLLFMFVLHSLVWFSFFTLVNMSCLCNGNSLAC